MKHRLKLLTGLFAILFGGCSTPGYDHLVYTGTYTGRGSDGIYAFRFHPRNGELKPIGLVARTRNPSFITIDPDGEFLYAVNEVDSFQNQSTGAVSTFAIDRETGRLTLLQQVSSLGAGPAHISMDGTGKYVLVANYNGGNASVFPIEPDGRLGEQTAFVQDTGSGPNPDRQAGPHAHFIQVTNNNAFALIADLGTDQVLIHRFDVKTGSLAPAESAYATLPPGSGPRHIAFSPSGKFVYVLNELTSEVTVFMMEEETGRMQPKQALSALPDDFSGKNTAAAIVIDSKGHYLYVSNRGADNIGCFMLNPEEGSLAPINWVSCGGKTPRHVEIDPAGKWLMVANQDSDNIAIFSINQDNGQLKLLSDSARLDSPVCIKFVEMK